MYVTLISIHWRLHKFINSSDTVSHAAGWSSNLQGDDINICHIIDHSHSHESNQNNQSLRSTYSLKTYAIILNCFLIVQIPFLSRIVKTVNIRYMSK